MTSAELNDDPHAPVVSRTDIVSWQGRLVTSIMRYLIRPILNLLVYLWGPRYPFAVVNSLVRLIVIAPRGTRRTPVTLPHCDAVLVRAPGVADVDGAGRVALYFHGGAFVVGGTNSHLRVIARLSAELDAPVLSVDYRMWPHATVSDGVQDCVDGFRWLLEHGYSPDRIAVAGDSAGGYMAFMVPLTLIKEGQQPPAAIAALSALTELDPQAKRQHRNLRTDALIPPRAIDVLDRIIFDTPPRVRVDARPGPLVEPTREDLSKMPPTLMHAASTEIVLHDAELMADRLAAAGVPVHLKSWAGLFHVFQIAEMFVPESRRALCEIGDFIRQHTR